MTRPSTARAPTLAALRKEARRVFGEGGYFVEAPPFGIGHEFVLTAAVGSDECDELTVARLSRTEARKRMAELLRALPSATPKRRGKGRRR